MYGRSTQTYQAWTIKLTALLCYERARHTHRSTVVWVECFLVWHGQINCADEAAIASQISDFNLNGEQALLVAAAAVTYCGITAKSELVNERSCLIQLKPTQSLTTRTRNISKYKSLAKYAEEMNTHIFLRCVQTDFSFIRQMFDNSDVHRRHHARVVHATLPIYGEKGPKNRHWYTCT